MTGPGGVKAEPRAVISGIIDIVRTGDGPEASRKWANACVLSGECIKACDYGVNPRFLLGMARVAMARHQRRAGGAAPPRRGRIPQGGARRHPHLAHAARRSDCWRGSGRDGQPRTSPRTPPDFVFYTGCNVLKTPHIALLALDIMDTLGVTYQVMGGPTHCCGVVQMRTGDIATSGRFAESTMDKLARSKSGQVVSWCPSCHTQFTETTLPTIEKMRGAKPFEMTPFMLFLRRKLDRLRPLLSARGDADRLAPPSRHQRRGRGRGGHPAGGARGSSSSTSGSRRSA